MDEEFGVTIRLRVEDATAQPIRSAEQRMAAFGRSVDGVQRKLNGLTGRAQTIRLTLVDRVSGPLRTLQGGLSRLVSRPYQVVVSLAQKVGGAVAGAAGGALKGIAGGVMGAVGGIAGSLFSPITAAIAGIASIGALLSTGGRSVGLASDLEQTSIAFEQMLGSGEKAVELLTYLRTFAAQTPFEFPELADATRQLMAYGFAADEVKQMLTPIGDAVSGLGGTFATTGASIVRALGQMRAKGKVQTEELLQLQELGIPALQMLASAFGKTVPEMQEMVTKGLVPADKAIDALMTGIGQKFPNMMLRQSRTLRGLKSTLLDTFNNQLLTRFGQGIAAEVTPRLAKLVDWLDANQETVKRWGDALYNAGRAIAGTLLTALEWLITNLPKVGAWFADLGARAKPVTDWLIGAWRDLQGGVAAFLGALEQQQVVQTFLAALQNFAAAGRDLWTVLSPLLMPVLSALWELLKLLAEVAGVVLVFALKLAAETLLALSVRTQEAVTWFGNFVAAVQDTWHWLTEKLAPAFTTVRDAVAAVIDKIAEGVEAVKGFAEKLKPVTDVLTKPFTGGGPGGGGPAGQVAANTALGPNAQRAGTAAIEKGMSYLGSQSFINKCLQFVDDMFGTKNRLPTAWAAAQQRATTVGGALNDVPAGMAAYMRADPSNQGAGHVMVSLGNGQFLDPSSKGVRITKPGDPLYDYYSKLFYGYGPGGDLNAATMGMQAGGVIAEPVVGRGLRTGTSYAFGERGPEMVAPLAAGTSRGAVSVVFQAGAIAPVVNGGDPGQVRDAVLAGVLDALAEAYEQIAPNVAPAARKA